MFLGLLVRLPISGNPTGTDNEEEMSEIRTYFFFFFSSFEDVKKIQTKENTSSVSLHPSHKKFVAGSDDDLWVRIYDFEKEEVVGKK